MKRYLFHIIFPDFNDEKRQSHLSRRRILWLIRQSIPTQEKTIKTYDLISDSDLENALANAHALYKKWKSSDALAERISQLHRLATQLRRNKEHYAKIITEEVGKIISESRGEVELSASIAEYYADHGKEFMAPCLSPPLPAKPIT